MKRSLVRVVIGLLVVAALLMIGPTTKSKLTVFAGSTDCQFANLEGDYAFSFSGFFNSGNPIPFTPIAAGGTITFRPNGTIQRNFGFSFGGQLFTVNDSGTYSPAGDCTFSAKFPNAGEQWNMIPVDDGREIEFFINTTGRVGSGALKRR